MATFDDGTNALIDANSRTLAPGAVLSQVVLMTVISVVTIVAFNLLRPKNKIIYEPKIKYHTSDVKPVAPSSSLFGWLPPLIHTKEPELLAKLGMDAAIFLRFLRLMRLLFSGIAVISCGILLPINLIYNLKNVKSEKRDVLSMLTIRDVSGDLLYAHVAATYIITIFLCTVIWIHWKAVVLLRQQYFRSPEYQATFAARTLVVMDVPRSFQSDAGLQTLFNETRMPYPTTSVHIGRKVGKLPELIEYHNETVCELEKVLVRYLKGGRMGRKRPTVRIGGWCGMGGQVQDAIEHYTAKLQRTERAIQDYRAQIDTRKAENYGFASMAAVPYAHIAAKKFEGRSVKGSTFSLAPSPKDIIWDNMNKTAAAIAHRKVLGFVWLAFVCFVNTIPLLVISLLANLDALAAYVPFLGSWSSRFPTSFAVLSGVLPPAVSAIFGFFLPIIMRRLTRYMGATTHSRLDRAVVARYFTFLVISQLIIFTLLGVIFNSVKEIVRQVGKKSFQDIIANLDSLPGTINRTYIDQASYWLTYFPLRGFLAVFDLAQIINLLWLSFKTRVFGRTPRDIRTWTQPPDFEYAVYYSNILFMGAVGLVFAPLAPLVVLAAAIVFWVSSVVYKYQLMFVFVSKVESGGRLWNVIINRLMFCVVLMQALMCLTIGIQYGFPTYRWVLTLPPILMMLIFKIFVTRRFERQFRYYLPTEDELRLAKVHSERADHKGSRLEKRFGHPALHADLFTPMLHANMMPLLGQVYKGKINREEAKLDEYGGQKMEASVIPGGIKIAAIQHSDLEYDLAQYQRDRADKDWSDTHSMASTAVLGDNVSTLQHSKSQFYANSSTTRLAGYDQYLAGGLSAQSNASDIELARMDSLDTQNEPLLSPRATAHFSRPPYNQQFSSSSEVISPPAAYTEANRQAPLHRNMTGYPPDRNATVSPHYQQQPSQPYYPPQQQPQQYYQQHPPPQDNSGNMAGRGTFRG